MVTRGPGRSIAAVQAACFAIVTALVLGPWDVPDPLGVGPDHSWPLIVLLAATAMLACEVFAAGWPATRLDLCIAVYVVIAGLTLVTGVDRQRTLAYLIALAGQLGLFAATVAVTRRLPRAPASWFAAFLAIAFVDLLLATLYHAQVGFLTRPILYPSPAGWTGYPQLATLAVMQLAVVIAALMSGRQMVPLLAAVLLAVVTLLEVALLYARGAWVAAGLVLLVTPTLAANVRHLRRAVIAAAVLVAVGAAATYSNPMLRRLALGDRSAPLNGYNLNLATPQMRFDLWRRSVKMVEDHPLTGVGLGNFQQVFESVYNPEVNNDRRRGVHAHNLWLQQFGELGVPGGLAYVALTMYAFWLAWSSARRTQQFPQIAVLLALTALAGTNLTTNLFADTGLIGGRLQSLQWMLFGFAAASAPAAPTASSVAD